MREKLSPEVIDKIKKKPILREGIRIPLPEIAPSKEHLEQKKKKKKRRGPLIIDLA